MMIAFINSSITDAGYKATMSSPFQSYCDQDKGKLGQKQLAQGCTYAPGNIPSQGPWFQARYIHLFHICPTFHYSYLFNDVHLAGKQ